MSRQHLVIVGLGYVGLPLAIAFARSGANVTGLDIIAERAEMLNRGESYIDDIDDSVLRSEVEAGRFSATTDPACVREATHVVICVPTPLTAQRSPDMHAVQAATMAIAQHLQPGQLVVLESTTYPGTTVEVLLPILEASGLTAGQDFHLAFSPERIDPGSTGSSGYTIRNTPKLVGGLTETCSAQARELYSQIVDRVIVVSSPDVAEMAKLFENIFRNVNIALVNELAMLCDRMNLDVWEILDAAGTKPFGFMRFNPGPGVGGHCIPIDPFYLTWKAREYGFHTRFIELAGEINENMPRYIVNRVMRALNEQRKSLNGANVLAIGVAYKPNIADMRESPAVHVIEGLLGEGATVSYHDPHVPNATIGSMELRSVPLDEATIRSHNCVVVLTDHTGIDWDLVSSSARAVVDTRNRVHLPAGVAD